MKLLLFVCLLGSFFFYCYVLFVDTDYDHTIIYIRESHSNAIPIQLRLLKNVQSANVSITPNPRANITNISSFEQSSLEAPLFFATVESVIKRNTINETIILYCTDNGYIDLFLNGYYTSQLWNYKNLVVTCFDRLCYQKLYKLNIPVALLNVESDTSVDITKAAICHTKEFQNKVHYKLVLWDIVIKMNIRILYVDSDVILLKNPFYYLNSFTGYDIVAQRDAYLCSGFMYMYPTRNTKLAVERSIKIRPKLKDANDQSALIAAFKTIKDFHLYLLPSDTVPSGIVFFKSHNYYWDPINQKQLTIHNNYIHGLENKLYRFKEIKMYKLDRNQEYSNPSAKYLTIETWSRFLHLLINIDNKSDLFKAINLAIKLHRVLVIPPFECRKRSHFCTLFDIFGSDESNAIVSKWKSVIRESVWINEVYEIGFFYK